MRAPRWGWFSLLSLLVWYCEACSLHQIFHEKPFCVNIFLLFLEKPIHLPDDLSDLDPFVSSQLCKRAELGLSRWLRCWAELTSPLLKPSVPTAASWFTFHTTDRSPHFSRKLHWYTSHRLLRWTWILGTVDGSGRVEFP